jgi:hypothetical protein
MMTSTSINTTATHRLSRSERFSRPMFAPETVGRHEPPPCYQTQAGRYLGQHKSAIARGKAQGMHDLHCARLTVANSVTVSTLTH